MQCMSCKTEIEYGAATVWNRIVVCNGCKALAIKAERDIEREIERAKQMAKNWLEQHVLRGGLLAGGDGGGAGTGPGNDAPPLGLPWMRGQEATDGPSSPDGSGDRVEQDLGPARGVHSVQGFKAGDSEQQSRRPRGQEADGLQGDA